MDDVFRNANRNDLLIYYQSVIQTYPILKSLFKQFKMPKVIRQRSHLRHVNSRRSIESIKSNDTETFSSEDEKILFHPGGDIYDINFSNGSVLNDISDLFTFCKEQINTRFISVLIYMSLRHLGHTRRDVDSFLTSIG
ncbi:unnamed protein product, partial [Rotaria magnacalcarata]